MQPVVKVYAHKPLNTSRHVFFGFYFFPPYYFHIPDITEKLVLWQYSTDHTEHLIKPIFRALLLLYDGVH